MPTRRKLPVLDPARLRRPPRSFAWIDHRLRSSGLLEAMEPADFGLYLFLVLAADRDGLSCWRLDIMERAMPCFDRSALWEARDRLRQTGLVAFQPWRIGDPDGSYQILALPDGVQPPLPGMQATLIDLAQRLRV
jgi:hypothetical protein